MDTNTTLRRRDARRSGDVPAGEPASPRARASRDASASSPEAGGAKRRRNHRGAAGRSGARESGVIGLAERARLMPGGFPTPLLDPLFSALPTMRHALLNRALDDALRAAGAQLSASLSPSVIQVWIAEPGVWAGESDRVGGLELFPTLRVRASVTASAPPTGSLLGEENATDLPPGVTFTREAIATDPLIEEVATTRHAIILTEPDAHPLAQAWLPRLRDAIQTSEPGLPEAAPIIGTLLALPLRARGQFLGVVAIATRLRLAQRQLTALEELSDLVALAADRDRLLSYSRTQEALAQTMVRNAPVAMALLTGPEHVVALANPAFFELFSVEQGGLALGLPLASVIPESARLLPHALRLYAVYQGSEPQAMVELPIALARGDTYWNVSTSPVIGEGNVIGGVLVAAVDVTRQVNARHRAQESADMAQERIGQMLALHDTTLATASQLGADPRDLLASILRRSITLLNAQAGVIYARAPRRDELEVVVTEGLRGDYTGSHIRIGQGLAGTVAQTGQGRVFPDYRVYPSYAGVYNDESFTALISVPLVHHGQVVGVLDVLNDADRRAFTDDDLWLLELFAAQAAQALENARMYVELERAYRKQRDLDRMKDDFIATASHELRTPLTGVKGFLELLLDYPAAKADPLMSEFVQQAANSADELEDISDRLLQTSRLDTGRMELRVSPVRLAPVVEESLRSFRALEEAQGGAHILEMDLPAEVYVQADLGRLKDVLDNLISNAIKYSPRGGRVRVLWAPAIFEPVGAASDDLSEDGSDTVSATPENDIALDDRPTISLRPIATASYEADSASDDDDPSAPSSALVEATQRLGYHAILVADEGMGIPDEERNSLFGRFSRLESARASQIRGTGLGLYICRQTLRAMGGDIWLHDSVPGRGSVFAFALPDATAGAESRG